MSEPSQCISTATGVLLLASSTVSALIYFLCSYGVAAHLAFIRDSFLQVTKLLGWP